MLSQDWWFAFLGFFATARRRAPAVVLLILIIACFLYAAEYRPSCAVLLMVLIGLLILVAGGLLFSRRCPWIADIMLLALLGCAAMLSYCVFAQFPVLDPVLPDQKAYLGVIDTSPAYEEDACVFTVRLIEGESRRVLPYRMQVHAGSLRTALAYGDIVSLEGSVRVPSPARNPGGFNGQGFFKRKGIHYLMYTSHDGVRAVAHRILSPFHQFLLYPVKCACVSIIKRRLAKPYSSLLLGLTVGQRGEVPDAIRAVFTDAGIIHILAVSGLHVGIISFFLLMVLRSLRVRFPLAILISCLGIILYALVVDLRAPVLRATLMFTFIMFGILSQRRILLVNIIAASAVLVLLFRPADIFDPGFQLSYAATFSIVIFHQRLLALFPLWVRKRPYIKRFLLLPFAVSLSAQMGTGPIVAFHFFRCSMIAPLANVVMVPFVFFAIPLGFLMVAGNVVHPLLGKIYAAPTWFSLHGILRVSDFFASLPLSAQWVRRPGLTFMLLYYGGIFAFFFSRGRRRIVVFLMLMLIVLNVVVYARLWHVLHPRMCVHFLDVGQGDALVVELVDGYVVVIDGGVRNAYVDYGERVLLPFLRSKGIRRLHAVVATHPDADHCGGLISLLESVEVGYLLVNGEQKQSRLYRTLLATAQKGGIPVYAVHRGEVLHMGITPFYVLHPPQTSRHLLLSSNERSIVLKCGYGSTIFLLTGDYANRFMPIPPWALGSTVLKFPHHGAPLKNVHVFLEQVDPGFAVISVGKGNRYGHPAPENMHVLRTMECAVYRTDHCGGITITAGTHGMEVSTMCHEVFGFRQ